ncbi:MAG: PAS domain-containing protein [Myxococcaceae bacterium]|nr:PAS domain-containing protein [Myxococcaceae bacterium]
MCASSLQELPRQLPEGLVVLADPGRSLEEGVQLCRELHSRRNVLRTHLVVLTERGSAEHGALIHAGADECVVPPGGNWLARLTALSRRLVALGLSGSPPLLEELPSEPAALRDAVQMLLDSTQAELGHQLFGNFAERLARTFRACCVLVGEILPDGASIRSLAYWLRGSLQPQVVYSLRGTPCDEAIRKSICHVPDEVARWYPEDEMLSQLGMRGYLGAPLKDGNGNAIGVIAILNDQPLEGGALEHSLVGALAARASAELERLRAQAELERTRDFLRNTLDAVPDPLFVLDRSHRYVIVNRAFCGLLGRSEQELLGRTCRDLFSPAEAEAFWEQDEQAFGIGQPLEQENTLTNGAGQPRTLITKKAVFTEPGGAAFLIITNRDITDRKRLEMQLRLADRLSCIGTLAAGVVHEINNPLAYVCSNLSFLEALLARPTLAPDTLPELREVLAETQEGIQRMRTIVQDVKTFARSDEERCSPVSVPQAIDGALRLVRKQLQYRAGLERALEPVPAVLGNEGRLGQVLVNLLVNALQAFTQSDPERNRVRISARSRAPDRVVIEVEDNGSGMSPEVRQHLFDPFFTTKAAGAGSGLGLAISQSIIQSMGGTIEVESEPGRGSVFRLVLPAVQAPERSEVHAREAVLEPRGPRRRLLLIDAEPAVGTSVRRLLQEAHEVESVQDVSLALRLLAGGARYDAILCDLMLPGMSGMDFLRELEQHDPGLARRTGFMSSGAFSTPARELMAAWPGEFLEKPFEPERLRSFVQRLFA